MLYKPRYRRKKARVSAKPARALVTRVKKLEKKTSGIESKFFDFTLATTPISPNINDRVEPCFLIVQGDANGERNGDSITITSMYVQMLLTTPTAGDRNMLRMIIVLDKQCNGATPQLAEIFADGSSQDNLVSPLNLDNKHRFRLLSDELVEINDQGRSSHIYRKYLKCNIKIRYEASTSAITDLVSNNLIFYPLGLTAELGDIQGIVRIRYYDS